MSTEGKPEQGNTLNETLDRLYRKGAPYSKNDVSDAYDAGYKAGQAYGAAEILDLLNKYRTAVSRLNPRASTDNELLNTLAASSPPSVPPAHVGTPCNPQDGYCAACQSNKPTAKEAIDLMAFQKKSGKPQIGHAVYSVPPAKEPTK